MPIQLTHLLTPTPIEGPETTPETEEFIIMLSITILLNITQVLQKPEIESGWERSNYPRIIPVKATVSFFYENLIIQTKIQVKI